MSMHPDFFFCPECHFPFAKSRWFTDGPGGFLARGKWICAGGKNRLAANFSEKADGEIVRALEIAPERKGVQVASETVKNLIIPIPRDIMQDNDSLVRREFSNLLTPKDEAKIREAFIDPFTEPDDDINTSVDQTKNLRAAIAMGLKYPTVYNLVMSLTECGCFLPYRSSSGASS